MRLSWSFGTELGQRLVKSTFLGSLPRPVLASLVGIQAHLRKATTVSLLCRFTLALWDQLALIRRSHVFVVL